MANLVSVSAEMFYHRIFNYGIWGSTFTSDDVAAQHVALVFFLIWCFGSLALTVPVTAMCARSAARSHRALSANWIGLLTALVCFPVLVLLRLKHLEPELFPIPAGITLAAFACFWSVFCSLVAWVTARRFRIEKPTDRVVGTVPLLCSEPLLIALLRGCGVRSWVLRALVLVAAYVFLSGPALLACYTPIEPGIVAVYRPVQVLCMVADRSGALLLIDVVVEYWDIWCNPSMNPLNPRPML